MQLWNDYIYSLQRSAKFATLVLNTVSPSIVNLNSIFKTG